ncbi:MAG: hypothetical protein ACYDHW_12200 [Syntrophorhabdaceae bacterium]
MTVFAAAGFVFKAGAAFDEGFTPGAFAFAGAGFFTAGFAAVGTVFAGAAFFADSAGFSFTGVVFFAAVFGLAAVTFLGMWSPFIFLERLFSPRVLRAPLFLRLPAYSFSFWGTLLFWLRV